METEQDQNQEQEVELKAQSVTGFILIEASKAIIGFIAVWLFKPLWVKLVEWWKNRQRS